MILIDTSALILSLTGERPASGDLRAFWERNERLGLPSLVLYEWLRGPRNAEEIEIQEALFPGEQAVAFDHRAASIAADLYRRLARPRARQLDIAIAATALAVGASLWSLNPKDFSDIPGLVLAQARQP